jgi:hypothetical protein
MLIDDVEKNVATGEFLEDHPDTPNVISVSSDGEVLIGCLIKPRRGSPPDRRQPRAKPASPQK